MKYLLALLLLPISSGCSTVKSTELVGLSPVILSVGGDSVDGKWQYEDQGVFSVSITDSKTAELFVTELKERTDSIKSRVILMAGNEWYYANVPAAKDGSAKDGYLFALIKRNTNKCTVWLPDFNKFKKLIHDGIIDGTIENGSILVTTSGQELIDIIETEERGLLFKWEEPHLVIKLKENKEANMSLEVTR